MTGAGLAPGNPKEAAIAAMLSPGLYPALRAGLNDTAGIGIVEVYDRGAGPQNWRLIVSLPLLLAERDRGSSTHEE